MYSWLISFINTASNLQETSRYSGDVYDHALSAYRMDHCNCQIVNVKRDLDNGNKLQNNKKVID